MQIFGFEIRKTPELPSIATPDKNDGAIEQVVGSGAAYYGYAFDINKRLSNEYDLINKYRSMAQIAEIDSAIDEIVTEAIVVEEEKLPISINIVADDNELPPAIQQAIVAEFQNVLALMDFNSRGHDIFRQWYVDGRLYGQIIVDESNLSNGIMDIKFIDPRKIKKVREVQKEKSLSGVDIVTDVREYFIFNDAGISTSNNGIQISPDVIIYSSSGLTDEYGNTTSHLTKTIKPANMVRYMEDAVLIYTLSRAPERRVFYIDVGDMPKQKAEQYMRDVMTRYKNKVIYNSSNGEIADDRVFNSLQEDFWLPRRCFSLDTKVKLLDGRDVSIADLSKEYQEGKTNWTYSVSDDGRIVPGMITWAGTTMKNAQVVDVHLDNGEVITCTPDHKFILRNGEKVQAQYLQEGTSLMPLYTEKRVLYGNKDYEYVLDNSTNKWKTVHKMVSEYFNGPNKSNEVVHHANLNRFDNTPCNLVVMDKTEHLKLHTLIGTENWKNASQEKRETWKKNLSESSKRFFATEEGRIAREKIVEKNKTPKMLAALARGRDTVKEMREYDKLHLTKEEFAAKWIHVEHNDSSYAHEARAHDKATISKEDYYNKWVAPITNANKEKHNKRISSYDMGNIIQAVSAIKDGKLRNSDIISAVQSVYPEIKLESFRTILKHNGYETISDFIIRNFETDMPRRKYQAKNQEGKNHKVVKVVFREDRMDVGTLTVDGDEINHSFHNYALSAGVFVMNSNGRTTEITTLPGSSIMTQMDNVNYFLNKLYASLNIPLSRVRPDANFSLGRSTEISRDEVKFSKFIARLRKRFSDIFYQALRAQLILKGIIAPEDWTYVKSKVNFDFLRDNYFSELKENEILSGRIQMAEMIQPYVGTYYSMEYVRKNVLKQTTEEIERINMQIAEERAANPEMFGGGQDQEQDKENGDEQSKNG